MQEPLCLLRVASCRGTEGANSGIGALALQCEWLLGDRKPSPEELDKGIDPDSPLFQAILDNPVVQLGLTNPKTLLGMCAFFTLSRGSGRLAGSLVGRAGAVEATRRIQR